jgi:hypothetical protein
MNTIKLLPCLVLLMMMAACTTAPADETLPTLAVLPTNGSSATTPPPSVTPAPNLVTAAPVASPTPEGAPMTNAPAEPTDMSADPNLVPPTDVFMDATSEFASIIDENFVFPDKWIDGEMVALQGRLTLDPDSNQTRGILTDSQGNTLSILLDQFLATSVTGEWVELIGTIFEDGDGFALSISQISFLE